MSDFLDTTMYDDDEPDTSRLRALLTEPTMFDTPPHTRHGVEIPVTLSGLY